jgi:hypothetical protein
MQVLYKGKKTTLAKAVYNALEREWGSVHAESCEVYDGEGNPLYTLEWDEPGAVESTWDHLEIYSLWLEMALTQAAFIADGEPRYLDPRGGGFKALLGAIITELRDQSLGHHMSGLEMDEAEFYASIAEAMDGAQWMPRANVLIPDHAAQIEAILDIQRKALTAKPATDMRRAA